MTTINVSLPDKLKNKADSLVSDGYYASFSDIVRTALRELLITAHYQKLADEAKAEYKAGKATVIRTNKELDEFFRKLK
jgi:Arc/MetJ-type ribon-helix-helix transcriptional regulator